MPDSPDPPRGRRRSRTIVGDHRERSDSAPPRMQPSKDKLEWLLGLKTSLGSEGVDRTVESSEDTVPDLPEPDLHEPDRELLVTEDDTLGLDALFPDETQQEMNEHVPSGSRRTKLVGTRLSLDGRIKTFQAYKTSKPYKKGPWGELSSARADLSDALDAWDTALSLDEPDLDAMEDQLALIIEALEDGEAVVPDCKRKLAVVRRMGDAMMEIKAVQSWPNAPAWFRDPIDAANAAFETYKHSGFGNKSADEDESLIGDLEATLPALRRAWSKRAVAQLDTQITPRVLEVLKMDLSDHPDSDRAKGALLVAFTAYERGIRAADEGAAGPLSDAVATGLAAVEAQLKARAMAMCEGAGKPKAKRKMLMKLAESDPSLLAHLGEDDNGRDLMDEVMGSWGASIKKKGDMPFAKEMMKARFGLDELKGDLDRKALPRLYKVFKSVPEEHTTDNEMLLGVKRNKNFEGESWYDTDPHEGEGIGKNHMVLNGVRTGGLLAWATEFLIDVKYTDHKLKDVKNGTSLNAFNHCTLHEIGHSVDAKYDFMDKRSGVTAYGGWAEHEVPEVALLAMHHFDLKGGLEVRSKRSTATIPEETVFQALVFALNNKGDAATFLKAAQVLDDDKDTDIYLTDRGVTEAVAWRKSDAFKDAKEKDIKKKVARFGKRVKLKKGDKTVAQELIRQHLLGGDSPESVLESLQSAAEGVDAKALLKHDAFKWAKGVVLSGADGLWAFPSKAAKLAIDGRVYHEAYEGQWVSYQLSARKTEVTEYQFRAPGEWFAEVYACYFTDKLKDGHPMKAWLDSEVGEDRLLGDG